MPCDGRWAGDGGRRARREGKERGGKRPSNIINLHSLRCSGPCRERRPCTAAPWECAQRGSGRNRLAAAAGKNVSAKVGKDRIFFLDLRPICRELKKETTTGR